MERHNNNRTRRQKPGFTLIELLVVIAIIAILAAILFPVFARARENARRASCQSNLKQMALGVMQYTQDYDEHFPLYSGVPTITGYGWVSILQPYIRSTQIFQCPSESISFPTIDTNGTYGLLDEIGYSDYGYNLFFGWQGGTAPAPTSPLSLSALTQPSLTVMLNDSSAGPANQWETGGGTKNCGGAALCTPNTLAVLKGGANEHLEGANFAFADGHVKWYMSANNSTTQMANVWNAVTTGAISGNNPTFNPMP